MNQPTPATARQNDLVIEHLGDETLVYDRRDDATHCLTPVAAAVWSRCDGTTTDAELVAVVAGMGVEHPEAVVEQTLADLAERHLLVDEGAVSRRKALRRIAVVGAAAFAAPTIISIKAPAVAEAATQFVDPGGVCMNDTDCKQVAGSSASYQCRLGSGGTGTTKYCSNDSSCRGQGATCGATSGAASKPCCSATATSSGCVSGVCR